MMKAQVQSFSIDRLIFDLTPYQVKDVVRKEHKGHLQLTTLFYYDIEIIKVLNCQIIRKS